MRQTMANGFRAEIVVLRPEGVYEYTERKETAIEIKNTNKNGETRRFSTLIFSIFDVLVETFCCKLIPVFYFGYA